MQHLTTKLASRLLKKFKTNTHKEDDNKTKQK